MSSGIGIEVPVVPAVVAIGDGPAISVASAGTVPMIRTVAILVGARLVSTGVGDVAKTVMTVPAPGGRVPMM